VSVVVDILVPDARVKVSVLVPLPGAARVCGPKLAVTPAGRPVNDRAIAELKPPSRCGVTVMLPRPLVGIDNDVALVAKVKPGTLSVRGSVRVTPPPLAVMTGVKVPEAAPEVAARVSVLDPEPGSGMLMGLKLAVTPAGKPEMEKATAELKPPSARVVNVTDPLPLGATVIAASVPDTVNPGTLTVGETIRVIPSPVAVTTDE
jgi:hypothetical protein